MDALFNLLPVKLIEGIGVPGIMFGLCLFIIFKSKGFQGALDTFKTEMTKHDSLAIVNHAENQKRFEAIEEKMETTIETIHGLSLQVARQEVTVEGLGKRMDHNATLIEKVLAR